MPLKETVPEFLEEGKQLKKSDIGFIFVNNGPCPSLQKAKLMNSINLVKLIIILFLAGPLRLQVFYHYIF